MQKVNIFTYFFNKAWESPTITTWFSYFTKSASLLFVLPMILNRFSEAEIAVYYLFASIISFASLADFGFKNTFVRLFAYAAAGRNSIGIIRTDIIPDKTVNDVNWHLAEKLFSTIKSVYFITSVLVLIIAGVVGTYAMRRPISFAGDSYELWLSWFIILLSSTVSFYGKIYICYLEGFNKVALVRRIESLFSIGAILSKIIVLVYSPTILNLVIVTQFWLILNFIRNYILSRYIFSGRLASFKSIPFDFKFFREIWAPAWRGGLSSIMSVGVSNFTSILYAQIGSSASVASYLLTLKVLNIIREVSMAPFYSKIPLFVKLRAQNDLNDLTRLARRAMTFSHSMFFFCAIPVCIFMDYFLTIINSNADFADPLLYFLLVFAFFIHRYGGMHMQLYLTTNHVIAHIVDGITGIIFLLLIAGFIDIFDVYVFPLAMLVSYLSCHAWVSARYSLGSLYVSFINFEKPTIFILIISFTLIIILYV